MNIQEQHNGSLLITEIIDNQLIKQVYYGFTRKESIKKFKQYLKEIKKAN